MKKSLVFVLLAAAQSFAAPPEPEVAPSPALAKASVTVNEVLLVPLVAKERRASRLSREYRPATERRLRIIDAQARTDSQGGAYQAFAVDARHGMELDDDERDDAPLKWRENAITGCVYPETRLVFVKRGDGYVSASLLLGKKSPRVPEHVCREQPQVARVER